VSESNSDVMRLLIASGNAHKLQEMGELLHDFSISVVGPEGLGLHIEVEETGATYAENAALKARAYAAAAELPALADDSGLEVDALDGAPGIYSARFGGPGLSDADRVRLLLERLGKTPTAKRTARYRCSLVLIAADGRAWQADGSCEGLIALHPRGSAGFGYDPVFVIGGTDQTMAELTPAQKNRISHRARAIEALRPALQEWLIDQTRATRSDFRHEKR
jgi:XTP/dITP diphosphohydrolase